MHEGEQQLVELRMQQLWGERCGTAAAAVVLLLLVLLVLMC
jgi:hypothetical protein